MSSQIPKSHTRLERDIAVYEWLHLVPWKAPKILSHPSGFLQENIWTLELLRFTAQLSDMCAVFLYLYKGQHHHGKVQRVGARLPGFPCTGIALSKFLHLLLCHVRTNTVTTLHGSPTMVLTTQQSGCVVTKKCMAWEVLQGRESSCSSFIPDEQTLNFDCQ